MITAIASLSCLSHILLIQLFFHYIRRKKGDESALVKDEIEIALQVLGKVPDRVMVPSDISNEELEKIALANERVQEFSQGKQVVKLIVVLGKLVNVVVK